MTTQHSSTGSSTWQFAGDAVANVAGTFFDGAGGLAGLRQRMQRHDLGHVYESWINSRHASVSPEEITLIIGDAAEHLAHAYGIDQAAVERAVAKHLPEIVKEAAEEEKAEVG